MQDEKKEKEENFQRMTSAFKESQKIIEKKNVEESKKYIKEYIAKEF